KKLGTRFGKAPFHHEIPALHVAKLAHPAQEAGIDARSQLRRSPTPHQKSGGPNPHAPPPPAPPRPRPTPTASKEREEGAAAEEGCPGDWIPSSARSSMDVGTVSPSARAVLRLSTSSNLVGCWIGSSPAFSPLRMRPT